tara:strand:+ start:10666 stop:11061 length:396 start_codon:yes stop_codon:yes gene_type:complete
MGSNNTRIRSAALDLLFSEGPMTIDELRDKLHGSSGVRVVPSQQRITALLSRTMQVEAVGSVKVQKHTGWENQTLYDLNRRVILSIEDIEHTTPYSHLSPRMKEQSSRCDNCKLIRLLKDEEETCLFCQRL